MVKSSGLILCLILILAAGAAASGLETWTSFNGINHPTPTEIEIVEENSDSILVDMTLNGMNIRNREEGGVEFQFLSVPQADWTDETGKPKLPVVRTLLAIPSDSEVKIQIEDEEHTVLQGYNVYPVPEQFVDRSRGEMAIIEERFAIDSDFYASDVFYPMEPADISFSGYVRDQRMVQLEFRPIRHNPHTGELVCYSFLRVRLIYGGLSGNGLPGLGPMANMAQYNIANYEQMAPSANMLDAAEIGVVSYPGNLTGANNADYLIIAPEAFYSSQKLKDFAEWRASYSGLDVAVVSFSKLYYDFGSSGEADESIRSFINYVYNFWKSKHMTDGHIGYVLLVGDVEFLPVHISDRKSFDELIATDNWYVCVSGDDLMPDVMLGRLPAKNINELDVMIDKIIQYEQNPLYGEWTSNALLMAGTVESLYEDLNYARDEYLLPAGYNVTEVGSLNGGSPSQAISEINKGQYIIDYAGHGWVSGWEVFQASDILKLRNSRKLPAVFSLACSTGYFDNPDTDSLAEKFVKSRYGAIAFFGSSRLAAISNIGFGLSEAVSQSHVFNLGEITMHAKLKLLPNSTNMELYNLIGDPALDLSAPRRQPGMSDLIISPIDISFEPEDPKQGEEVHISVSVNNFGAADARNVTLQLRDNSSNGSPIETQILPRVPAGSTTVAQTVWRAPMGQGQHEISVEAYPENIESEYYRENNDAQKTLFVSLEAEGWPMQITERTLSAPLAVDLDVDGDKEILIQTNNYSSNKIYVWHHDGETMAGWPETVYCSSYNYNNQYSNSSVGTTPAVGDLDGDGTPEIVAAFFTKEVFAYHADGSKLQGWPVKTSGYASSSPVLADLDADGKLEVILGLSNGQVQVQEYDGEESQGWPVSTGKSGHMFPVVVDMDGDDDLEIVALRAPLSNSSDTTVQMYAWHHDGTEVDGWPVQMQGGDAILPPSAGDLDGDGTAEIVAVTTDNDYSRVYVWDHNGSSKSGWPVTTVDEIDSAIALGDIDRDGDLEVVACGMNDFIYAWHSNGRLVFGWPVKLGDERWNSAPVLGDVDGDGELEILFSSYGGVINAYEYDGVQTQGWPAVTEERYRTSPPAIVDINGDGKTELVLSSGSGNVHLLSLSGLYTAQTGNEWNMLSHDPMRTGSYSTKTILPLPPIALAASDQPEDKGGSIAISWELSPDDASATGYIIYRSDSLNGRYSMIGKVQQGVSSYTDDKCKIGTTYWYMVRTNDGAYLSTGSEPVSAYSFNNFAPEPPASIYAKKGSIDNTIDIQWFKDEGAALDSYKVYHRVDQGEYGEPVDIGSSDHYTLTGLNNGTVYYVSITAYDSEGNESLPSAEASATPGDDDTDPPSFSAFEPQEIVEGTAFYIRCKISDPSGVYDNTPDSNDQSVYMIWDNDGELSESFYKVQMSRLSPDMFKTREKIPEQPFGAQFVYKVLAYDDDCDWNLAADRTPGTSEEETLSILRSPSRAYNYPNPAPAGHYTDRTIFHYGVPSDSDIEIKIYDIAGNLVDVLEDEARGVEFKETEWDISNVASGIYVYLIEIQTVSGNKQVVKNKLAIVK